MVIERRNLVVARAVQAGLCVGDFDRIRHARLITPPRLRQFLFGELDAFPRGRDFIRGGTDAIESQPDVQFDLFLQIPGSSLLLPVLRETFGAACVPPSSIEDRY